MPDLHKTNASLHQTPVDSILQPNSIYGVSKAYGELLGHYYAGKHGVDYRALRYPGIMSSERFHFKERTTSYSTEIFFEAIEKGRYECFLKEDAYLALMHLDDCIAATVMLI